jgi:type I restriction enzyme S subunit
MNQHVARIRVTASDAEPEFVFQVLAQPAMRRYFSSTTTGQAYPQISLVQVRDAEIPFPPLDEQRAVAEAVGDVDALLSKLDQLIAKKRDLKQAAMQQLLTGRIRLV